MNLLKETQQFINQQRFAIEANRRAQQEIVKREEKERAKTASIWVSTINDLYKTWEVLDCPFVLRELHHRLWPGKLQEGPLLRVGNGVFLRNENTRDLVRRCTLFDAYSLVGDELALSDVVKVLLSKKRYENPILFARIIGVGWYADYSTSDWCKHSLVRPYSNEFLCVSLSTGEIKVGIDDNKITAVVSLSSPDPKTLFREKIDTAVAEYLKTRKQEYKTNLFLRV